MKKASEKSFFSKYKTLWDNAKNYLESDKKNACCIRIFAVNSIFTAYKQNNSILSEIEKKEFEAMIRELNTEKKQLGSEANTTAEEFIQFLKDSFASVDDEDRHGEVTMNTSVMFKFLGEIIDVLTQWGSLPDEWAKKKKYCKFKALDIFKSIKAGVVPKKGGPKEEEDEVGNELSNMIEDQKNQEHNLSSTQNNKKEESIVNNNQGQGNNSNVENLGKLDNVIGRNEDININEIKNESQKNSIEDQFNNPCNINQINTNSTKSVNNLNFNQDYESNNNSIPKSNSIQNINQINSIPNNLNYVIINKTNSTPHPDSTKKRLYTNNVYGDPSHITDKNYNLDNIDPSTSIDLKKNQSFLAANYQVNQKLTRKLDFTLPVKFKSIEYFRLCDVIKKQIDTGLRELNGNKLDKCLAHAELAYYYLDNINQ